jgi:hypothetical protein
MPIFLASWEAEIKRITVLEQPKQKKKFHETPSLQKKLAMVVHACHPSDGRKHKQEDCSPAWAKNKTLSSK